MRQRLFYISSGTFLTAVIIFLSSGCSKKWDNFTTYYNTYYNAQRIMFEAEDEFDYLGEKEKVKPRVFVPEPEIFIPYKSHTGPPVFMREFIISQQKRQPVAVKLDSIEIKGSKILAKHPKSDYIEGTLYLMAKAYFYQNAWIPSQIKCSELIDRFPAGDFSADAHLLMAKNYLIRKKFYEGQLLLSRCVDIAWQRERYDILSSAFRLEAELALYQGDEDGALRPYKQAIAQTGDSELKAKWQIDMAALLFRMRKFERAERAFAKVSEYSPDYVYEFEGKLYRSSCLARLGRIEEAEKILEDLENDGKFEEWIPYVFAERINILRLQKDEDGIKKAEVFADSAYIGNHALMTAYFELGMDYFQEFEYHKARVYFARSKSVRTPVFETSQRLYYLINLWDQKKTASFPQLQKLDEGKTLGDTALSELSLNLFELGRVHEQLGNKDSCFYYYRKSVGLCPRNDEQSARYMYAYARVLKEKEPYKSDSLLDEIVERYPFTEYGQDAIVKRGFETSIVVDTVAELYASGDRLRKFGEYNYAIEQFTKIYTLYPETELAPKSIYSIGWIYERHLLEPDSALTYYQLLISTYPYSKYAQDVRLSVDYLLALRSGGPIPDSLKNLPKKAPKKGKRAKKPGDITENEKKPNEVMKSLNSKNIMDAPGNFLNQTKDALDPTKLINNIKLPESPLELFSPSEEKEVKKPDSSKAK